MQDITAEELSDGEMLQFIDSAMFQKESQKVWVSYENMNLTKKYRCYKLDDIAEITEKYRTLTKTSRVILPSFAYPQQMHDVSQINFLIRPEKNLFRKSIIEGVVDNVRIYNFSFFKSDDYDICQFYIEDRTTDKDIPALLCRLPLRVLSNRMDENYELLENIVSTDPSQNFRIRFLAMDEDYPVYTGNLLHYRGKCLLVVDIETDKGKDAPKPVPEDVKVYS